MPSFATILIAASAALTAFAAPLGPSTPLDSNNLVGTVTGLAGKHATRQVDLAALTDVLGGLGDINALVKRQGDVLGAAVDQITKGINVGVKRQNAGSIGAISPSVSVPINVDADSIVALLHHPRQNAGSIGAISPSVSAPIDADVASIVALLHARQNAGSIGAISPSVSAPTDADVASIVALLHTRQNAGSIGAISPSVSAPAEAEVESVAALLPRHDLRSLPVILLAVKADLLVVLGNLSMSTFIFLVNFSNPTYLLQKMLLPPKLRLKSLSSSPFLRRSARSLLPP